MISIKTPEEIQIMQEGGKKLASIMKKLEKQVGPGKNTAELDAFAEHEITKAGAKPAFKNYQKFPGTLCTSVNEELVHVIPSNKKILKEGDIITLDLGLIWPARPGKGFYVDMARTVPVGEINDEKTHLIRATRKALRLGIAKTRPGNTTGDIGNTIQRFIESQGYNVVRNLCGHGIGRKLHEEPPVLNYGKRKDGPKLKEGMVICIEPMVTQGSWQLKHSSDNYGYATKDGTLSAHFEDTIAVTKEGAKVLTTVS